MNKEKAQIFIKYLIDKEIKNTNTDKENPDLIMNNIWIRDLKEVFRYVEENLK